MCVLKIENKVEEIPQNGGVRQGDNMVPVLFLFLMKAFTQILELEWMKMDDSRQRTPCRWENLQPHSKNVKIKNSQCLYVDDGAFPFGTREDLQCGMELIHHHFARFGLEMQIGCGTLESKTECVPPPPSTILPTSGLNSKRPETDVV